MAALNLVVAVAASESVVASPGSNGGLALPTSLGARQFCRRLWRWQSCQWQRVRVEAGGGSIGRPLLLAVAVPSRRQRLWCCGWSMFVIFLLLAPTIFLPFLMCRGKKCVMGGGKFGESASPRMVMEMRWDSGRFQ